MLTRLASIPLRSACLYFPVARINDVQHHTPQIVLSSKFFRKHFIWEITVNLVMSVRPTNAWGLQEVFQGFSVHVVTDLIFGSECVLAAVSVLVCFLCLPPWVLSCYLASINLILLLMPVCFVCVYTSSCVCACAHVFTKARDVGYLPQLLLYFFLR